MTPLLAYRAPPESIAASMSESFSKTRKNTTLVGWYSGHFHPTETISDKISSVLLYLPEILLHVSRGVRWDSDHVVTLNDDLLAIIAFQRTQRTRI